MDALDPGPEPRDKEGLFNFGLGVAILGVVFGIFAIFRYGPFGCGWVGLMVLGLAAAASARYADRDLESRHKDWEEKSTKAKTHWWCEACHTVFLPEGRHEKGPEDAPREEITPTESLDIAGNIEPLRRQDSD